MKKNFFLVGLFKIIIFNGCGQANKIPYGNNPRAGKYYKVRGINLYVETYGHGQPLLLIHGNGGDISAFYKNIPYFEKRYKVIAVDSRAQGNSVDNGDSLSFEMMADDFAALLDKMHIDSADVIGWSDGGINALLLAMRHPKKVKKLVASGANLWPDSTAIMPDTWLDDHHHYLENKDKTFTDPREKNDWKIFLLDWQQPNISLSALHAIRCPSLIVAGDHDVIREEHTVKIFQNIPHANLWILPNSSHSTLQDHADEFNDKVDTFFTTPFESR